MNCAQQPLRYRLQQMQCSFRFYAF